jgi:hypothetical protein
MQSRWKDASAALDAVTHWIDQNAHLSAGVHAFAADRFVREGLCFGEAFGGLDPRGRAFLRAQPFMDRGNKSALYYSEDVFFKGHSAGFSESKKADLRVRLKVKGDGHDSSHL